MLDGVTPHWLRWMFGRIARRYDLTNTVLSAGLDASWRRRLARQATLKPAGDILDIACGTGGVLRHLARRTVPATRLVGIDVTEAMLRVGAARLARTVWHGRPQWCAADAQQLPFHNGCFDVVTIMFGVRNFADPLAALLECYRVLRPHGRLCIVEFDWPRGRSLRLLYGTYFRYILPLLAWPLSGERTAYRYLRDSVLAFRAQPGLASLLQQAGFTQIRSMPLSGGITILCEGRKQRHVAS